MQFIQDMNHMTLGQVQNQNVASVIQNRCGNARQGFEMQCLLFSLEFFLQLVTLLFSFAAFFLSKIAIAKTLQTTSMSFTIHLCMDKCKFKGND